MAKAITTQSIKNFSTRLEIRGENAKLVREGLDAKNKKESRKSYTGTIEAILVDHFTKHKY